MVSQRCNGWKAGAIRHTDERHDDDDERGDVVDDGRLALGIGGPRHPIQLGVEIKLLLQIALGELLALGLDGLLQLGQFLLKVVVVGTGEGEVHAVRDSRSTTELKQLATYARMELDKE
jgi:hypothetical protein